MPHSFINDIVNEKLLCSMYYAMELTVAENGNILIVRNETDIRAVVKFILP